MSRFTTLRPGAHIAGAALLAALALLDLVWIVRDFQQATDVTDAWWMWSGLLFRAQDGIWASSFVEPTLLVLYTVCAVTVLLSSSAAGILFSTGLLTVLLRVPTLWNLNASWVQGGVSDALRLQVLWTTIAMLALAVALIVTVLAGRRPAGAAAEGTGTRDEPPAPPTRAGAPAAAALLGTVAAVLAAWEVNSWVRQGWSLYSDHFTGDRTLVTLLAVPESWYGWSLVLLAAGGSVAALRRSPLARPLGMTISAPLLGLGLFRLSFASKSGILGDFGDLLLSDRLWLATALFEVLAALALLAALAGRGDQDGAPHPGTTGSLSSA